MRLDGLRVKQAREGKSVHFVDGDGQAVLNYSELKVWDANGERIPARMEAQQDGVTLSVDEHEAAYPLTVDPLFLRRRLNYFPVMARVWIVSELRWHCQATSPSWVLIAMIRLQAPTPAALTFSSAAEVHGFHSNSSWPATAQRAARFWSLSRALGRYRLIGAFSDDTAGGADAGSAYIFIGNGSSWAQQQQLLAGDGAGAQALVVPLR